MTAVDTAAAPGGAERRAARVVSINLCTDQLALMLAAPGQLVSVTGMAQDPRVSPMAGAAAGLVPNHARAEEIYLLAPDLVLAGTFTAQATVAMLERLGIPVMRFEPAYGLADIGDRLREMGAALGRPAEGAARAERFAADLAALRTEASGLRAALYAANGYTSGPRSLAGEILTAAGFRNVAAELGLSVGGRLALEELVMAAPDLVVSGRRQGGPARAEEVLEHPALAALGEAGKGGASTAMTDRDWICGTPHVLDAVRDLAETRAALERR